MIYKFKSKATGDLIMTQPVADRVLALIGKPPTPQGIIEVDQLPAAMSALEAAVAAESPQPAADDGDEAKRRQGRPRQPAPARVADGGDDEARARRGRADRLGRLTTPEEILRMSHGEATRLIAVRHGETAWNVEARLQGQLDIPLNERGLEQARRTAHWLAEDHPDVVVSSDLARAQATAQAIASFNRIPLELDAGLRERSFGGFQGMTHTEVAERWPELSRAGRAATPSSRRAATANR